MSLKQPYTILFFIAIGALAILYGYPDKVLMHPYGPHNWRQCDCAQFALNYYTESMNFFEPRLSYCDGNDGKMGSEFPIIYYIAAILYHLFGVHDCFIRIIDLLIFFMGLFYLFRAISLFLNNRFYGLILSLMVFTSPVVIYYANNFLPDVPAVSLSFIGIYYFLNFRKEGKASHLWKSTFFFTLSGLLKLTALIPYLAIVGYLGCMMLLKIEDPISNYYRSQKRSLISFVIFPLTLVVAWVLYIKYYNSVNHNTYFLTTIAPIWTLDSTSIHGIVAMFNYMWIRQFIYREFLNALPVVFVLTCFITTRKNIGPLIWVSLLLIGAAIYLLLFFKQFNIHDYYLVCFISVPIGISAVFFYQLKNRIPVIFNSIYTKFAVFVLLLVMIHHGYDIYYSLENRQSLRSYYDDWYKMQPVIDSIGIKPGDKIMSIGDLSTGISLYFVQRRGWTSLQLTKPAATEYDFEKCISKGAKYVIVSKEKDGFITEQARKRYLQNELIELDKIKIYKL